MTYREMVNGWNGNMVQFPLYTLLRNSREDFRRLRFSKRENSKFGKKKKLLMARPEVVVDVAPF